MRHTTDTLRRETQSLSTALRKPQVRGRWGEMHLRRAVELAGLVDRCDFTEQAQLDGGALRPDLVVRLAGDKSVVVDAKVPLDAFLDATGTDDDDVRADHLERHARQLRTHVDQLSAKRYWRALPESPEFVVLFVPGEAFLSAALEADRGLLEHAADAPGHRGDPDHPDRVAAHGRARLEPRGAGRPGPRDPPPRPGAARAAGPDEHPPRPGRALAQRDRRALQPGRRLTGEPGAGQRPEVRRDGGHRRRAAGAAAGREHQPVRRHAGRASAPSCTPPTRRWRSRTSCSSTSSPATTVCPVRRVAPGAPDPTPTLVP